MGHSHARLSTRGQLEWTYRRDIFAFRAHSCKDPLGAQAKAKAPNEGRPQKKKSTEGIQNFALPSFTSCTLPLESKIQ